MSPDVLAKTYKPDVELGACFSEEVLYLRPYPGLSYNYIDLCARPKAVLHDLYHSGAACAHINDERFSVLSFASKCAEVEIPFFIAPLSNDGAVYESCRDIMNVGAIAVYDMSVEAALVKIMLAYGNQDRITDFRNFIQNINLAYEIIRSSSQSPLVYAH